VKAPFSAPKNSDSISVSGIAAQLTATNGPPLRRERAWSARAASSFPVPLSPARRIVASVPASFSTRRKRACIEGERPTRSTSRSRSFTSSERRRFSSASLRDLSVRSSPRSRAAFSNGFVR
jgi:hypothetical protein